MSTTVVVPKRRQLSATDNIPPEIFEEILCTLPAKSVGRFKCVSKSWKALISTPRFITAHLSHSCRRHDRVTCIAGFRERPYSGRPQRAIRYSFSFDISSLKSGSTAAVERRPLALLPNYLQWDSFSGCCNGLVLATVFREPEYVINPTTQQYVEIPLHPLIETFEPYYSYGLGYHSLIDDYWVVFIGKQIPNIVIHIYSLRKKSWRILTRPSNKYLLGCRRAGVFWNGCLHWICINCSERRSSIVSFNIEGERFEEDLVHLPWTSYRYFELVALSGCLCLIDGNIVWVMKEYGTGESWKKISVAGELADRIVPLCFVEDREIIFKELFDLWLYKVEERNRILIRPTITVCNYTLGCYIESLVSPFCSDGLVGGSEGLFSNCPKEFFEMESFLYHSAELCMCSLFKFFRSVDVTSPSYVNWEDRLSLSLAAARTLSIHVEPEVDQTNNFSVLCFCCSCKKSLNLVTSLARMYY